MHTCRDAFRRRNSLLHEVDEAIKADEVIEADEADGATEADGSDGAGGAGEISRRSR